MMLIIILPLYVCLEKNEPIGWEPIMFSKKALKVEVSK
jgi:hypothetical protein